MLLKGTVRLAVTWPFRRDRTSPLGLEGSVEQGRVHPAVRLCFLICKVNISVDPSPRGVVRIKEFVCVKSLARGKRSVNLDQC